MPSAKEQERNKRPTGFLKLAIQPVTRSPPKTKPSYFWGEDADTSNKVVYPVSRGYVEARNFMRDGSQGRLEDVAATTIEYLNSVYTELKDLDSKAVRNGKYVVELRLSDELEQWRDDQLESGHKLPSKGSGIVKASNGVIRWLGAENWAPPLVANGALWGAGLFNILQGAYDATTLYSNYCVDMAFYYEHCYDKVFPEFKSILQGALDDPCAMSTPHGTERRLSAKAGLKYIRDKVALEEGFCQISPFRSAKMDRETAFMIMFCESSGWGAAGEAISRGWDKAAVAHDFAFSAPGTDVVDVGSDHCNSELFNSFLNTADITNDGIITVEKLRRIYDAFAHCCARMFTERWTEPGSRFCTILYPWHIINGRHFFLRRALLGFPLRREPEADQREGDWDEVFSPDFHTTGISRPLANACNGAEMCDQVQHLVNSSADGEVLSKFWHAVSISCFEYARAGKINPEREEQIAEQIRVLAAEIYSLGLVENLSWLMSHASQHAWQVNYLFEAGMFGSLLDDQGLRGKLDRNNH